MDFRRLLESMRTRTAFVLFLTAVLVGGLLTFAAGALAEPKTISGPATKAAEPKAEAKAGVAWRDLSAGLDEAKSEKKPLVVSVYTDWCGWCKRMDRDTYTDEEVRSYVGETFVPVKLNAESNARSRYRGDEYTHRQIASGFKVTGYPTTLFLDAAGAPILTAPGYMNARDYLVVLRYVGEGAYKTASFDDFKKAQVAAAKPANDVKAPAGAPAQSLAPSGSR